MYLCIYVQVLTWGEDVRSPEAELQAVVRYFTWALETPLQEHQIFLTAEPSFQPYLVGYFQKKKLVHHSLSNRKQYFHLNFLMCIFCYVYNLALTTDSSGFISPSGRFWVFSRVWWLQWSAVSDLSLVVLGKKNWCKAQEEAELLLKPLASGGLKFFFEWIIGKFTFKDEWVYHSLVLILFSSCLGKSITQLIKLVRRFQYVCCI